VIITRTQLAQHVMDARGSCVCACHQNEMWDVWFVPHSCCLLSLTFLKYFPAKKLQKSKYCFSQAHPCSNMPHCNNHISIHLPHPPRKNTHHTNIISTWQTAFPLPSSPFRTNNPLHPLRQHSLSRQRKSVRCNRPNYPTHAVLMSSLHQETKGVP
jgi:hypothetical protein